MDRIFIIAEAGVNHNGKLDLAFRLCDIAKSAGADAVKFQTYKTEKILSRKAKNSAALYRLLKSLELSYDDFMKIKHHCDKVGIEFFSTPDEEESLMFLVSLGLRRIKIGSGEIGNLPFLRKVGCLKKEVILSTGMADLEEIGDSLKILVDAGTPKEKITLLHCNTAYPTVFEDVNLRAMITIRDIFKTKVGYSDHSLGIEVPIAAVALGASVIEKHLTLNRNMEGPDHKGSLESAEFRRMVMAIRNIEKSLGSGSKRPSKSEKKNIKIVRKSIIATRAIKKGEVFTEEKITVKRPGIGISPMRWNEVIGNTARRNFSTDEFIEL